MRSNRDKRGFSLIEAVLAVGLLGVILVIFQGTLRNMPLIKYAKNQDLALKIASSELESLRAGGYAALPVSGTFSDPLISSLPSGAGAVTVTAYNAETKQVIVTVSWREEGRTSDSSVALTTLVTEIGGL